jgi:predicted amidophosphoribosyltransferase
MAAQPDLRGFAQLQRRGQQAWSWFIDLLFPPRCGGCQTLGSLWCDACRTAVQPIEPPWCEMCGEPFVTDRLCANCREHPLAIEKIRSAALFDGTLRQAIHRLSMNAWPHG